MYYKNIYGYFNYEFLYDEMIKKASNGARFVEIGAFQGKSTCYLAERVIESGKAIKISVIDNWVGHPSDKDLVKEIEQLGDVFSTFKTNMERAGVIKNLDIIRGDSSESASGFEDRSLDFVYIDAAHDYTSVVKDIKAWLPKVKVGGTIAGHDYGSPNSGVKDAVNSVLGGNVKIKLDTWMYEV